MYNIDFIGPLPKSSLGSDMMMICVDRFSRRVFLYACSKHATSEDIGDLFVTEMCMREGRGIPRVIISDNDKLFTANFWRQLFRRMGTKLKFTHGARIKTVALAFRLSSSSRVADSWDCVPIPMPCSTAARS